MMLRELGDITAVQAAGAIRRWDISAAKYA
jgi:hypothetical protein